MSSALDLRGATDLHLAAESGDVDKVRQLLTKTDLAKCVDSNGQSPLHYACARGHVAVVGFLSEMEAASLARQDANGRTALMLAAGNGHGYMVDVLIRTFRSPLDIRDKDGWGVLHHACSGGHVDIVRALIQDFEADVNAMNDNNDLPIHVATSEVALNLVKERFYDPSVKGHKRQTLLHTASAKGDID